ncbi:hypothetical protein LCGC14_1961790, partial [marine sediment metagenome]
GPERIAGGDTGAAFPELDEPSPDPRVDTGSEERPVESPQTEREPAGEPTPPGSGGESDDSGRLAELLEQIVEATNKSAEANEKAAEAAEATQAGIESLNTAITALASSMQDQAARYGP